jgi:hypothetical protein
MSVFNRVGRNPLEDFPVHYPAASLADFEGAGDGIENTNHPVGSEQRELLSILIEMHGRYLPRTDEVIHKKDPAAFRRIIKQRRRDAADPVINQIFSLPAENVSTAAINR